MPAIYLGTVANYGRQYLKFLDGPSGVEALSQGKLRQVVLRRNKTVLVYLDRSLYYVYWFMI